MIRVLSQGFYGLMELAARTAGPVSFIGDQLRLRDREFVYAALDQVLAGSLPFYRMQFQLTGDAGTFVSGGNVKVYLQIDVPSSIPSRAVSAQLDIAVP